MQPLEARPAPKARWRDGVRARIRVTVDLRGHSDPCPCTISLARLRRAGRPSPSTSSSSSGTASSERCTLASNRLLTGVAGQTRNEVVMTIDDPRGGRRVEIYRRSDGRFGFEEWAYGADERAWYPVGRFSYAVIDTLERAEQEAGSRVSWLQ